MKPLRLGAMVLVVLGWSVEVCVGSPLSTEKEAFLQAVRTSALAYTQKLPDFICTQITHRTTTGTGFINRGLGEIASGVTPGAVVASDVIEERLTYFQQRENYVVVAENGRKVSGVPHTEMTGIVTAGEFGSELRDVFDPRVPAAFTWDRETNLRGRRVWVFAFRVPLSNGARVVSKGTGQVIVAAYQGHVFVDTGTKNVLRMESKLNMPAGAPVQEVERVLDYEPVTIGGMTSILPFHAEVRMRDDAYAYMNTIDFKDYHRFAAESTIHYGNERPK